MNLAKLIPFWNSLDSIRRVQSDLELAALVCFALLVFFDVLAHWSRDVGRERKFAGIGLWCFAIAVSCELLAYSCGRRNNDLSQAIIVSLSDVSKQAASNATTALTNSGKALTNAGLAQAKAAGVSLKSDELQERIKTASTKLELLEANLRNQSPRYSLFDGDAGRKFKAALLNFRAQKIDIQTASTSLNNPEVQTLSLLLFAKLSSRTGPNWSVTESTTDFVSPEVMIGLSDRATDATKAAAGALAKALGEVGISDVNGRIPPPIEVFSTAPPDTIWLMIGAHMAINKKALDGSQ